MARAMMPVALIASLWARSIASPSRISTSEGGTTMPRVLATQMVARLCARGTPHATSLGWTIRDRVATLAPTEPLIGASSAPSPIAASSGAERVRESACAPARNRMSASGRRFSSAPIKT